VSASTHPLPMWYRVLAIVVGVISIVLALVVLADPALGLFLLVFLLGFALLVIGIDRLVTGVTGHWFGWSPVAVAGPPQGAPPAGRNPP
jgi:uncharacterized membrane protein HdeD (DUF308 family)